MNDRQRRFTDLYLNGPRKVAGNATRAADLAGYRWPGKQGPRLLQFAAVGGPIRVERAERLRRMRREHRAAMLRRIRREMPWQ